MDILSLSDITDLMDLMNEDPDRFSKTKFPLKTKIKFKKQFWNFVTKYKEYKAKQQQHVQQDVQQQAQLSQSPQQSNILMMDKKLMPIYRNFLKIYNQFGQINCDAFESSQILNKIGYDSMKLSQNVNSINNINSSPKMDVICWLPLQVSTSYEQCY